MRKMVYLFTLLAVVTLLFGCQSEDSTSPEDAPNEVVSLKLGLMPAVDALPVFIAINEGLFEDLNVSVDVELFTNANNRQTALQTNEIDGALTDLVAFLNNWHNGFETQIVTSTDGSFSFLVNDQFNPEEPVSLGIMEVSVTNYLADTFIAPNYTLEKTYIPEIPTRLEMLAQNQLDMALIPEPVASIGERNGLTKAVSVTDEEGESVQAIVFTKTAIEENEVAIKRFVAGYNEAIELINADTDLALDTLIEELDVPPEIKPFVTLPSYKPARLPSRNYMEKITAWVEDIQGITIDQNIAAYFADFVE